MVPGGTLKMTKKIAVRLAKWLYSSNAVENISLPILIYGGEVIISAMIGISLVVLVEHRGRFYVFYTQIWT